MVDRTIIYPGAQIRAFDVQSIANDAALGVMGAVQDAITGNNYTGIIGDYQAVLGGFEANFVPGVLEVVLNWGRINASWPLGLDPVAVGAIQGGDNRHVVAQAIAPSQVIPFDISDLSPGQTKWALIECRFGAFADKVRLNDPTGGVIPFRNVSTPSQELDGPDGAGGTVPTVRPHDVLVAVTYGSPATAGGEVPPQPTTNWIPMYLVHLQYGQTNLDGHNFFVAGPSVAIGVPNTYPYAPFGVGYLNSHHSGIPGQSPKIALDAEVRNILPMRNLPASSTRGTISAIWTYFGNPNGIVIGTPGTANTAPDMIFDTKSLILWVNCSPAGTQNSIWTPSIPEGGRLVGTTVWQAPGIYTFTPKPITATIDIVAVGGGGAGGTAPATASGTISVAGGGSSGAIGYVYGFPANFTSLPVTVGSGGIAVPASAPAAGPGGSTSVGTIISCPGGPGAPTGVLQPNSIGAFGPGGAISDPPSMSGYAIGSRGQGGFLGIAITTGFISGAGGSTPYGAGGPAVGGLHTNGAPAGGYGGGGSGGGNVSGQPNDAVGGYGAQGVVIITEYS